MLKRRTKVSVKRKPNTHVIHDDCGISFALHNTTIVRRDSINNNIVLNSGGWRTPTTKRRMNQIFDEYLIPLHVYQQDYDWYVYRSDTEETIEFTDYMELSFGRTGGSQ
mgnify:CR=1 FL=1